MNNQGLLNLVAALTGTMALACCHAVPSTHDALIADAVSTAKLSDGANGDDWPGYGRSFGEQHFSPLTDINEESIGRLKLAWSMDLDPGNSVTAPIAVDGILYISRAYSIVMAIDAASGKLLWTFDPKAPEKAGGKLRNSWGSRGLAWWRGKLYVGTVDGRLIALDARNGHEIWSVMTTEAGDGRYITGAPRVFGGKVVIGHGGADFSAVRGYVTTYDAETGKRLWRFYTVPGDPARGPDGAASDNVMAIASKSWAGRWWEKGGGGTVWNAMTYDAETDTLLIGTGNGSPWNRRVRSADKGDNLFLCSIVAIDAKTGKYKWHYQINPGESWDYNAAMDIELADLSIDGKNRKVAMTAPKNGFFYVIDRLNGKLISAEPFTTVTWATRIDVTTGRPVENPLARYPDGKSFLLRPSPLGGHNWPPMSFSPQTGLAYIPSINMATRYNDRGIDPKNWVRRSGQRIDGAANYEMIMDKSLPGLGTSALIAWDPVQQKEKWRIATPSYWAGGTMATAGNLVFQGQMDGRFNAYAADSGKRLWSFDAQNALSAPPISYRAGGRQMISIVSGNGTTGAIFGPMLSRFPLDYRAQKRRILTFTLDGRGALPAQAPPVAANIMADPDYRSDPSAEAKGMMDYGLRCTNCHGLDMIAGGNAPDLRLSPVPLDADAFTAVVKDGGLVPNGMPRFYDLSATEVANLRQYIRARRRR